MQVHFAFQDGFANDDVIVRVNGKEIIRESKLEGRDPLVPIAVMRNVEIEGSTGNVDVEVPSRGLSRSFKLDFRESPYLGIAIVGGDITMRRSARPFEYF